MSENKEAVEAVAQALAEVDGHNWTNPGCENKEDDKALREHYRIVARIAVNIASSHILEEAAKCLEGIADAMEEKAEAIRAQSEPFDPATSDERDAAVTAFEFRRAAATIRAAKEGEG